MLFPIRTDSPLRSTPYMNWAIVAANMVVFVVQAAVPGFDDRFALYAHDPWWPAFVTYAFLHGGVAHLLGNMLFLYIFGNNVNDKLGHLAYLAFYLAGAVFGGVGFVTLSGGQNAVVGASGAVAAVTGAYLVLFPRATITLVYFFFIIGTFEASSFWLIALFFVKDLVGLGPGLSEVAYAAHVAGTVYGFAICLALLGAQLLPRDQFDVLAMVRQWNRRRQYRDLVNKGFDPFGYGSPRAPGRAGPTGPVDATEARISELRSAVSDAVARHDMDKAVQRFTELRAIDRRQVVSRQAQLDVANHLASLQRYAEAAEAYEAFLQTYPKYDQIEQVQLMLGIVYSRYLGRYAQAKQHLEAALPRLFGEREQALARAELAKAEAAAVK
jgi:membrane associated rhomboid family serine protease